MDALLNALMAIGLLMTLILIIYLIDRVNSIEKDTRQVMNTLSENSARVASPFLGLAAKKLWDAMTGRDTEGLDPDALTELRGRYQVILSKHMEALYQAGYKDGFRGVSVEPQNTKSISTAKGAVESWIPSAQANALYQCGLSAAQTPEADWAPIRASMDEAGHYLLSKTQLDASSPLSDWLMPSSGMNGQSALSGAANMADGPAN
jgi:hypothetical protein